MKKSNLGLKIGLGVALTLFCLSLVFNICLAITIRAEREAETTKVETLFRSGRFVVVESYTSALDDSEYICYDRETGVEYLYIRGGYHAAMTPLLNSDGTPIVHIQNENSSVYGGVIPEQVH